MLAAALQSECSRPSLHWALVACRRKERAKDANVSVEQRDTQQLLQHYQAAPAGVRRGTVVQAVASPSATVSGIS